METNSRNKYSIRKADLNDIQILVSHRCIMFKEKMDLQGKKVDDCNYKKMEETDTKRIREGFSNGLCHAWIAEDEKGEIVASGAASICSLSPTPENLFRIR